jgi:hypothetical protein
MNVNDLAEYLFIKNTEDKQVTLNVSENGVSCTRELFFFCLDIMFKGLILLYGSDNKVDVSEITLEKFNYLKRKMQCANICCNCDITYVDTPLENMVDLWTQNYLNFYTIHNSNGNMKLEDYHFDLQTKTCIFKIWFEMRYDFH